MGRLFENTATSHSRPKTYCVEGGLYEGASHRLGRLNVFGVDRAGEDGGYVRVVATEEKDLWAALERTRDCADGDGPMPQMRSDWAPEEGSFHATKERLQGASYLKASSMSEVALVTLEVPPKHQSSRKYREPEDPKALVTARIRNPFEVPLEGLTLVWHYEGGRGKPLPRYQEVPLPTTAPGAEQVVQAPAALSEDEAWYLFASLSIEGTSAGCTFVPSTFRR